MIQDDSPLLECVKIIDEGVGEPMLESPEFGIHMVTKEYEWIRDDDI